MYEPNLGTGPVSFFFLFLFFFSLIPLPFFSSFLCLVLFGISTERMRAVLYLGTGA